MAKTETTNYYSIGNIVQDYVDSNFRNIQVRYNEYTGQWEITAKDKWQTVKRGYQY